MTGPRLASALLRAHRSSHAAGRPWLFRPADTSVVRGAATAPRIATESLAPTRGVLRLAGADLFPFLNGIVSNDVHLLEGQPSTPMYTALLQANGRFLHDLFLHRQADEGGNPVVLADVWKDGIDDLTRLLRRYKLRAKVDVAEISSEYGVWVRFSEGESTAEAEALLQSGEWPLDPRLPALGERAILRADEVPPASSQTLHFSSGRYQKMRVCQGVAEGGTEVPTGSAVPLEYNLDGLNAISFTKGCYVGQELVARTHFRGVVRKRIMPIEIHGIGNGAQPGADILPSQGGKPVGKIILRVGSHALGMLRLKAGLEAARLPSEDLLTADSLSVKPRRPAWWPADWGQEDAGPLRPTCSPADLRIA